MNEKQFSLWAFTGIVLIVFGIIIGEHFTCFKACNPERVYEWCNPCIPFFEGYTLAWITGGTITLIGIIILISSIAYHLK